MNRRRRRLWTILVSAAAALVAVLVALIATGYLVLPSASPSQPVTVTGLSVTLVQGTNASGGEWFGPSHYGYSGINGFPYTIGAGQSFQIPITLENYDNASHTLSRVVAASPFHTLGCSPNVPVPVPALEDDATLEVTVGAPSTSGLSTVLNLTIYFVPQLGLAPCSS